MIGLCVMTLSEPSAVCAACSACTVLAVPPFVISIRAVAWRVPLSTPSPVPVSGLPPSSAETAPAGFHGHMLMNRHHIDAGTA